MGRSTVLALMLVAAGWFPIPAHASELSEAIRASQEAVSAQIMGIGDSDNEKYAASLPVLRRFAAAGSAQAQRRLGELYGSGWGVPRDQETSREFFRAAAGQGDFESALVLGLQLVNYANEDELLEAQKWLRTAIERYPSSSRLAGQQAYLPKADIENIYRTSYGFLANFYLSTYGGGTVTPDDVRASVLWARRGAAIGETLCQTTLGESYLLGRGVLQDYVRAHMWSNMAAMFSVGAPSRAHTNRAQAEARMSPAQIAEAQRLARECLASNYKRCGEPGESPAAPR
jgi:TPR repeat protein